MIHILNYALTGSVCHWNDCIKNMCKNPRNIASVFTSYLKINVDLYSIRIHVFTVFVHHKWKAIFYCIKEQEPQCIFLVEWFTNMFLHTTYFHPKSLENFEMLSLA